MKVKIQTYKLKWLPKRMWNIIVVERCYETLPIPGFRVNHFVTSMTTIVLFF